MQQSRLSASVGINKNEFSENHKTSPSTSVKIYPSRPPAHIEQQKRQQRLQRQKDVGQQGTFRRSTSESLLDSTDEQVTLPQADLKNRSSAIAENPAAGQRTQQQQRCRPVLQRQQRQSSEETTESGRSANVHFKEDPEYFEPTGKAARHLSYRDIFRTFIFGVGHHLVKRR